MKMTGENKKGILEQIKENKTYIIINILQGRKNDDRRLSSLEIR